MAYLGIDGEKCPNCGSTSTTEYSKPTNYPEREIILKCYNCKQETSYGIYSLIGNELVKK
ncbi:MAG: hypothetical protein K9H48_19445 [Melioribacteraceae bacterium]|nr:hypothetical protein [Melioribacteraceae bacterium]